MRLRICGGFAVLGWGFSGALSGHRRQRGAGPGPWRGGRLHGVFKPVYGGSVVGGRAGGSCQCFSQQMRPAESSSKAAWSIAAAGFWPVLKREAQARPEAAYALNSRVLCDRGSQSVRPTGGSVESSAEWRVLDDEQLAPCIEHQPDHAA